MRLRLRSRSSLGSSGSLLDAVTDLVATPGASHSDPVALTWTDAADAEEYDIERAPDIGDLSGPGTFAVIDTVLQGVEEYDDESIP